MPLNPITVSTILTQATPSRAGLETTLLASSHTVTVGPRVSTVTSLQDAVDQGFTATAAPATYRALRVLFSQQPRPKLVKVGRRDLPPTQILNLTPTAPQGTGYVWSIEIDEVEVTYVEAASDTVALIIDGLVAAVTAAALGVTPTDNTTDFDLTGAAGAIHSYTIDLSVFALEDNTADPGLATDLDAIEAEDSDWYLLVIDSQSPAEVAEASAWVETRQKFLAVDVYTSDVIDPGSTTDIASDLVALEVERTAWGWTDGRISQYYAAGWTVAVFTAWDPGRATHAFKRTRGVFSYRRLNGTEVATLETKEVNWFGTFDGFHRWQRGRTPSGRWIDNVRLADHCRIVVIEALQHHLASAPKIPLTDPGIIQTAGTVEAALGPLTAGFDAPIATLLVEAPTRADLSDGDVAERRLAGLRVLITFSGSIHEVDVVLEIEEV